MRQEGKTIPEIASTLNVAKSSVSLWVRDIRLTSEQKSVLESTKQQIERLNQASKQRHEEGMERRYISQQEGRERARQNDPLHEMGCMLYLGEGAKDPRAVVFVNSDPHMMIFFMRFLRESLKVNDLNLRLRLHCHTSDVQEHQRIKQYWLDLFNLKNDCFHKVNVLKASKTRANHLTNGVCTICVYDARLMMHIYGAIQEYIGIDKPEWFFEDSRR